MQQHLSDVDIITPGPYIAQWIDPTATTERRIFLLGAVSTSEYGVDPKSGSLRKDAKQQRAHSPPASMLCKREGPVQVDCTTCLFSRHLFPLKKKKTISPASTTHKKIEETSPPEEERRETEPTTNTHKGCPICLEEYQRGNDVCTSKNACKHLFHTSCILDWLTHHDDCPICRVPFLKNKEQTSDKSTSV